MPLLDILVAEPLNHSFTYFCQDDLLPGQLVRVPFGYRSSYGLVLGRGEDQGRPLKEISSLIDVPPFSDVLRQFIDRMAAYTLIPRGAVLKLFLGTDFKKPKDLNFSYNFGSVSLSSLQSQAANSLRTAVAEKGFQPFLLDGVTGSGKTEVYFEAVEEALKKNLQSLVMVPEIALTTQLLSRFEKRFGFTPPVWHSHVTSAQKRHIWYGVATGTVPVVLGARSSLFLPFKELGLIVVDEEHEGSYKQEEQAIYHGRDMAVLRASLEKSPIVLSSATPSLESLVNVDRKRYTHLVLPHRHGKAVYPDITLIDRTKESKKTWISPRLLQALDEAVARGEQALFFLNRRGYAPVLLCSGCSCKISCNKCSVSMVFHQKQHILLCHHCGEKKSVIETCPECKQPLAPIGPGVERIAEELKHLRPHLRVAEVTSDDITSPQKTQALMEKIENRELDVLLGTQILAKGHHFPFLTLVGILDADLTLAATDPRATEKTFQLLHQVAGRAGREERPGHVYLQTYFPDHPVMHALVNHSREELLSVERAEREMLGLAPFGRLVSVLLSGKNQEKVEKAVRQLAVPSAHVEILGPAPAPLFYLKGLYRWKILFKSTRDYPLQQYVSHLLSHFSIPSSVRVQVDVDPYNFM